MIEDLQDEYSKHGHRGYENSSRLNSFLKITAVWIIFVVIAVLINLKGLLNTFSSTSPAKMIKTAKEEARKIVTRHYSLFFVASDGFTLKPFETEVRVSGANPLLESLEGLFQGPSEDALREGFITQIPKSTKIHSVSVSDGIATVTVSSQFNDNKFNNDSSIAKTQILSTLQSIDPSIYAADIIVSQ